MKTELWVVGKTGDRYLQEGIDRYCQRLAHYLPFQMVVVPDVRGGHRPPEQVKALEGEAVLKKLTGDDRLILLDERGLQFDSAAFARYLEQQLQLPCRRLVFLTGGAWGFPDAVYQRANAQLSLSTMTFSHQMIRLFFLEQLYRAMTILRNEPYHNA